MSKSSVRQLAFGFFISMLSARRCRPGICVLCGGLLSRGGILCTVELIGFVCLQLFARELARGWTSAGNEVLAFQRLELFQQREYSGPLD